MLRFPDQRFTVIVLSNLADFSPTRLAEQVAALYLADAFTAGPAPAGTGARRSSPPPREERRRSARELAAYIGRYYSAELDATYNVHLADGELSYRLGYSSVEVPLVPVGLDEWAAGRLRFHFLRDGGEQMAAST